MALQKAGMEGRGVKAAAGFIGPISPVAADILCDHPRYGRYSAHLADRARRKSHISAKSARNIGPIPPGRLTQRR